MTVMPAAGHPEAQAQRSHYLAYLDRLQSQQRQQQAGAMVAAGVLAVLADVRCWRWGCTPAVHCWVAWPLGVAQATSLLRLAPARLPPCVFVINYLARCHLRARVGPHLNPRPCITACLRPDAWQEEVASLASTTVLPLKRECYCARYIVRLLEAASAPSHPGAVTTLGPAPPSPSASTSSLQSVILSVLPRSLVVFQACIVAVRIAVPNRSFKCPDLLPACIRDFYFPLCEALGLMVQLWPDQRCRPAMLRLMARTAAAGAHAGVVHGNMASALTVTVKQNLITDNNTYKPRRKHNHHVSH
ncbi:hypothetical protein HaLaN_17533 [Haematococcus lacustris]|uniref:Uncharacterized protein n=1 Tax=Haematococcus lacustris TaxID=44745 RepID=A0A699ZPR2_HAELA|nr:hypothetical protein HaLaN_17533 [Haematococcus lacustris]